MAPVSPIQNYYGVLGVQGSASHKEIRRAYRYLALLHHPDKNAGSASSTTQFQLINTAWDTLGDPVSREEYDHTLRLAPETASHNASDHAFDTLELIFNHLQSAIHRLSELEDDINSCNEGIETLEADISGFQKKIDKARATLAKDLPEQEKESSRTFILIWEAAIKSKEELLGIQKKSLDALKREERSYEEVVVDLTEEYERYTKAWEKGGPLSQALG